ncbi:unnamed protein product [Alopecurus aequalis]
MFFHSTSQTGLSRRSRSTSSCLSFRKAPSGPNLISEQRIYGPDNLGLGDDELSADRDLVSGIGKELLAKIERCYEPVNLVAEGFCFGLLDPVSNIVVGQAIALSEKQERKSEPMLSQRSRDGLVAFLVALFPYLTNYRAMWYLSKADLDPLVAARLIINHRGMEGTFGFQSDTTVAAVEMALRCAAAAVQHPNPRQFALGWKLMSPFAREVANELSLPSATQAGPSQLIDIMSRIEQSRVRPPLLAMEEYWDLALARLRNKHPEMPPVPRPTMRRMLLTTIHGYYLQALASLPKDKLLSHYHHSLLHAGHCYGPLDPVSNILVNTIWYAHVYPLKLEKKVEIEAISTEALLRIAVRSLYGLVSFLCNRYPTLTPGQALQRLQAAGAYLQIAHGASLPDDGVERAYVAAAKAAHHPKPYQQAQFLGPSNGTMSGLSQLLTPQQEPDKVRPYLVDYFRTVVASSKREEATLNINVLAPWEYSHVMGMIHKFWNQHTRAVGMVKSAIEMFSKQSRVPRYEIHVICGVNEFVDGPVPVQATPSDCCSHINFLATRTSGTPPELFFAEYRNGSKEVLLCCPVAMPLPGTEQVRCFHCELTGSRIVHPAKESFLGRDREFEMMLGGQRVYSERHTNDGIISCSHYKTLRVDSLDEDQIYGDYRCDDEVVENFSRTDVIY